MKIAPLNYVQILLMILIVACPMAGVDWPRVAVVMQVAAACAAGSLAVVSLYATPIAPASFLSTTGIQAVHVIQGMIGTVVGILNGTVVAHPTWGPAIRIVSDVGGITMGVLGIFSPKALVGPIMALRIRRVPPPPPTPKEGLPR